LKVLSLKEPKQSSLHCMLGQYDYHTKAVGMLIDVNNEKNRTSPLKSFFVECSIFMHSFVQYLYAQFLALLNKAVANESKMFVQNIKIL